MAVALFILSIGNKVTVSENGMGCGSNNIFRILQSHVNEILDSLRTMPNRYYGSSMPLVIYSLLGYDP